MATFLMLSTVGPDGATTLTDHPERLKAVNAEVEAMGVKVVAQWALLGQYDFCTILDAPDETAMARVALVLGSRGTLRDVDAHRHPDRRLRRERPGVGPGLISATRSPGACARADGRVAKSSPGRSRRRAGGSGTRPSVTSATSKPRTHVP